MIMSLQRLIESDSMYIEPGIVRNFKQGKQKESYKLRLLPDGVHEQHNQMLQGGAARRIELITSSRSPDIR
jgi:hypothetical protein